MLDLNRAVGGVTEGLVLNNFLLGKELLEMQRSHICFRLIRVDASHQAAMVHDANGSLYYDTFNKYDLLYP